MVQPNRCAQLGKNINEESYFWDVSRRVLDKIEGESYVESKAKHNEYLMLNPYVAKKKFINLHSSGTCEE